MKSRQLSPGSTSDPYPTGVDLTPYQIVDYDEFVMMYDYRFKIPVYTLEELTPESLKRGGNVKRKNKFFTDKITSPLFLSTIWDYMGSGFDRGHLVAAGNHVMTQVAIDLTFTMANMAQQAERLNRVTWRGAEDFGWWMVLPLRQLETKVIESSK